MNLLDGIIESLRKELSPILRQAGWEARQFAESVDGRLEAIHGRLARDQERKGFTIRIPPAGSSVHVAAIPTGAIWTLEVFSPDAADIGVRLHQDGEFRLRLNVAHEGSAIRFVGPCLLTASQTGAATIDAYIQFCADAPHPRPTRHGGAIERGVAPTAGERDRAEQHLGISQ